jgi:crossover junction endodeoxyribonuclease RusA
MSRYLFVPGKPAPQGSTRAYVVDGHANVVHDNPATMPWRALIAAMIRKRNGPGITYPDGPVTVAARFVIPRRAHEPKRITPPHTRKPDADKLLRAGIDAMTGLIFTDDAQVTEIHGTKRTAAIGEQPGVHLRWARGGEADFMTLRTDLIAVLATADPKERFTHRDLEVFADAVLAHGWGPRIGMHDATDAGDDE